MCSFNIDLFINYFNQLHMHYYTNMLCILENMQRVKIINAEKKMEQIVIVNMYPVISLFS